MTGFRTKTIAAPSPVCEQLRLAREERQISISQAARILNVSGSYIEALECGAYDQLPGFIYGKSFLRVYARYLGLPIEQLLESFRHEYSVYTVTHSPQQHQDSQHLVKRIGWLEQLVGPALIRNALIVLVVLGGFGYLTMKVHGVIQPPVLTLDQPGDNLVTTSASVVIGGAVEQGATVAINGQPVVPDETGRFTETVMLQSGPNNIEVTAQKKHSQVARVYRNVLVVGEQSL